MVITFRCYFQPKCLKVPLLRLRAFQPVTESAWDQRSSGLPLDLAYISITPILVFDATLIRGADRANRGCVLITTAQNVSVPASPECGPDRIHSSSTNSS